MNMISKLTKNCITTTSISCLNNTISSMYTELTESILSRGLLICRNLYEIWNSKYYPIEVIIIKLMITLYMSKQFKLNVWDTKLYKYEIRIFLLKNKSNSEELWKMLYSKYAPSLCLLYIFPIFREICEYHVSKILPLLLRIIHQAFFSHLRTNRSVFQQVRDPSM